MQITHREREHDGAKFEVGGKYSRIEVQELLGLPEPTTSGKWGTGYAREGDEFYVFANVGTAGRTGHDYKNEWVSDDVMQWEAKGRLGGGSRRSRR